jgi:hypothetical protein
MFLCFPFREVISGSIFPFPRALPSVELSFPFGENITYVFPTPDLPTSLRKSVREDQSYFFKIISFFFVTKFNQMCLPAKGGLTITAIICLIMRYLLNKQ